MRRTKKEILEGVENYTEAKIVANNTVEYWNGKRERIIRLHKTDILRFTPDKLIINSGGWKTPTTRERINAFSPGWLHLHQKRSLWYISTGVATSSFYEGITIDLETKEIQAPIEKDKKSEYMLDKINKYIKNMSKIEKLPLPHAGDCLYCSFNIPGNDHLKEHMEEGYLPGALLYRALEWAGYRNPRFIIGVNSKLTAFKALRRYLKRQCFNPCFIGS
jgi:hypothetical protein